VRSFSDKIVAWYQKNKRDLPWRNTDDPYKIWISEIMLQQTRVDTVIPYYKRFLERFPTVYDLAEADQQDVLKSWEGLGYYSRGRNLHHASKTVVDKFEGNVPSTWDEITSLKGIGPYTASALLSIAFQKQYAVVDGNVIRVLSRYYGIRDDIRKSATKNRIQELADDLIPEESPGDFNQAVMELGAMVCTPQNPSCNECPLSVDCIAAKSAQTDVIPYKSPAKRVPHHQIAVGLILNNNNQLLIALRPNDSMLGGLWEFPGGKQEKDETLQETTARELKEELGIDVEVYSKFQDLRHAYSHFKITMHAFWCRIKNGDPEPKSSQQIKWVSLDDIDEFPFPKANKTLIKGLKNLDKDDLSHYLDN
jgi:A/G-specific adenine glycosylase